MLKKFVKIFRLIKKTAYVIYEWPLILGVDLSIFKHQTRFIIFKSKELFFLSSSLNSTVGSKCYSLICFALLDISEPMDPEILPAYENRVNNGQNPEGFFEGFYAYIEDFGMYPKFK